MIVRILNNPEQDRSKHIARHLVSGKLCIIDNPPSMLEHGQRWQASIKHDLPSYNVITLTNPL